MEQIIVHGSTGNRLIGTVNIEGAKNAALPILAATLLAEDGITKLRNVPILSDIFTMINVMKDLNAEVDFNEEIKEVTVDAAKKLNIEACNEYVSQMRASILVVGPLLGRVGHAKIGKPGGCCIGQRPIDLHLKAFRALGAKTTQTDGYVEVTADKLHGNTINLEYPSVGATQNLILAAVKAKGTTVITNSARELEVVELANFLIKMGANVEGAGTDTIRIEGVDHLHAVEHDIVQDRIETGTFMIAAAMTEGNVLIKDAVLEHNLPLTLKLIEMGAVIRKEIDGVRIIGPKHIKPADVKTSPHPGFPTDLQAPITAMLTLAKGTSVVTETVFENRFQHLEEMKRMDADIQIEGNTAVIKGGKGLKGEDVEATDLRAAAALVLIGLRAEGITRVMNLKYLDRGYYEFHKKLQKLGAKVKRIKYKSEDLDEHFNYPRIIS